MQASEDSSWYAESMKTAVPRTVLVHASTLEQGYKTRKGDWQPKFRGRIPGSIRVTLQCLVARALSHVYLEDK